MPARNLQMISYRTRVRDSSHDYYSSHVLLVYVLKGKATCILLTNQRPRKRTITLLVLALHTLRGRNIVFVPVLICAHCCT